MNDKGIKAIGRQIGTGIKRMGRSRAARMGGREGCRRLADGPFAGGHVAAELAADGGEEAGDEVLGGVLAGTVSR